jgi:urea transporter
VGGLIIGAVLYRLAIRRYGPLPMAAVLIGSVVAGLLARLVGQHLGLAKFNAELVSSHLGAFLHAPPVLGANGPAILWPAIAFWPLAACLIPAGLVLLTALRDRQGPGPGPAPAP